MWSFNGSGCAQKHLSTSLLSLDPLVTVAMPVMLFLSSTAHMHFSRSAVADLAQKKKVLGV